MKARMIAQLFSLMVLGMATMVQGAPLVVLEARGINLKPGATIDSARPISLREGEGVTLIASTGVTIKLRGRYSGPPLAANDKRQSLNPQQALDALINTRAARSSSIGAVRSGANAAPLPDPWLVDISRPGARCAREGGQIVWWRPVSTGAQPFVVLPIDKSWRADFSWQDAQDRMAAPRLAKLDGTKLFIISNAGQDSVIEMNFIPDVGLSDLVLASWMLEKGCLQQADALLLAVKKQDSQAR